MTIGMLEAEPAFAEIDLARNPRIDHPLQRPVDGGAADALVLPPNEIDEIVRAQMPLLAQKDVEDLLPFAGPLAASRLQPLDVRELGTQGQRSEVKSQKSKVRSSLRGQRSKSLAIRSKADSDPALTLMTL